MKKPLLKLTTLLCLSFCIVSFAQQDFQGKAYYMSKTTMDLDQWGGREISPEQRKRIEERMKTIVEKHGGLIDIDLSNQLTTFKITLPNG